MSYISSIEIISICERWIVCVCSPSRKTLNVHLELIVCNRLWPRLSNEFIFKASFNNRISWSAVFKVWINFLSVKIYPRSHHRRCRCCGCVYVYYCSKPYHFNGVAGHWIRQIKEIITIIVAALHPPPTITYTIRALNVCQSRKTFWFVYVILCYVSCRHTLFFSLIRITFEMGLVQNKTNHHPLNR